MLAFQKLISSLAKGANQRDKMFCFVMILRRYLDVENLKFEILVEAPIKKFQ